MKFGRLLICLTVAGCLGATYVATPFIAMWNLREAIKASDTAAIEARVVWPSVRESLRASLAHQARLLPVVEAEGERIRPTLWQRVRGAFGASMLDRFIDTYVTPEGLPKLFDYRRTWNERLAAEPAEPADATLIDRARLMWSRVKRAEFQTLTRVEVEMVDRKVPDRRIISVMELDGLTWKLTKLRILTVDQATRLKELEVIAGQDQ